MSELSMIFDELKDLFGSVKPSEQKVRKLLTNNKDIESLFDKKLTKEAIDWMTEQFLAKWK